MHAHTHTCRGFLDQESSFDYILLDAPCSSERHLAQMLRTTFKHQGNTEGTAHSELFSSGSTSKEGDTIDKLSGGTNRHNNPGYPTREHELPHQGAKPVYTLQCEDWSPSRTTRNAAQQLALLLSSMRMLRPGGWLVYRWGVLSFYLVCVRVCVFCPATGGVLCPSSRSSRH